MAKTYEIACQQEITPLYVDIKKAIDKGRAVRVEVKSVASKTSNQLAYYRGLVLPRIQQAMKEHGNELSQEEVNQFLNEKFFCTVKTVLWKVGRDEHVHSIRTAKSKSGATKDEMSKFLEDVIRWAAQDLGCFIPEPVTDLSQVPF